MKDSDKFTLNIFTNFSEIDPHRIPLKETIKSFESCFGFEDVYETNVFVHPFPFKCKKNEFENYVYGLFNHNQPRIYYTYGLSHGYCKSLVVSRAKYCFQLEHDWLFLEDRINHKASEIIGLMNAHDIHYLRFNKSENIIGRCDTWLSEELLSSIALCKTPCRSNNPHFVCVQSYLNKYLHLVDIKSPRSYGIEEILWGCDRGYIYGPKNYPATIEHLDGRARTEKLKKVFGRIGTDLLIKAGIAEKMFRMQDLLSRNQKQG